MKPPTVPGQGSPINEESDEPVRPRVRVPLSERLRIAVLKRLRLPVLERLRLPVLAGPLRGARWLPAAGGKVARVLLGTYEPEQTGLLARSLRPGDTFLDLGAHVGFHTLLAARLVGPAGWVVAFEPSPRNARYLRRHLALNGCGNVRVEEAAVSDAAGAARFLHGRGTGTGRLSGAGGVEVRTVALDGYCAEHGLSPAAVKIDVEGAELAVLRGAEEILTRCRPLVFLSTHGAEAHGACLRWLRERGYAVEPILGRDVERSAEVLGRWAGG